MFHRPKVCTCMLSLKQCQSDSHRITTVPSLNTSCLALTMTTSKCSNVTNTWSDDERGFLFTCNLRSLWLLCHSVFSFKHHRLMQKLEKRVWCVYVVCVCACACVWYGGLLRKTCNVSWHLHTCGCRWWGRNLESRCVNSALVWMSNFTRWALQKYRCSVRKSLRVIALH